MLGLQGLEFLGLGLRIMGLHGFQGLGPRDLGFGSPRLLNWLMTCLFLLHR